MTHILFDVPPAPLGGLTDAPQGLVIAACCLATVAATVAVITLVLIRRRRQ